MAQRMTASDEATESEEHAAEVARLRRRAESFVFEPLRDSPGLDDSVARSLRGERIVDSRPV